MKRPTLYYCKFFKTIHEASDWCSWKNRTARQERKYHETYAVINAPDDDYAVVNIEAAIQEGSYAIID